MTKHNPTLNCPKCGNWDCPANCDLRNIKSLSTINNKLINWKE